MIFDQIISFNSIYLQNRESPHTKPIYFLKVDFISFLKHLGFTMWTCPVFKLCTDKAGWIRPSSLAALVISKNMPILYKRI